MKTKTKALRWIFRSLEILLHLKIEKASVKLMIKANGEADNMDVF
jgi:hypothetical protein